MAVSFCASSPPARSYSCICIGQGGRGYISRCAPVGICRAVWRARVACLFWASKNGVLTNSPTPLVRAARVWTAPVAAPRQTHRRQSGDCALHVWPRDGRGERHVQRGSRNSSGGRGKRFLLCASALKTQGGGREGGRCRSHVSEWAHKKRRPRLSAQSRAHRLLDSALSR